MSPIAMTTILALSLSALAFSLIRRWKLLRSAKATESRFDRLSERVLVTLKYAFGQRKLTHYPLAGTAHILIFAGFLILLLRSLILWGRAFVPSFNFWIFGPESTFGLPLGHAYELLKDTAVAIVLVGALIFVFLRVVRKEKRMTLRWEGLAILGIIILMMIMDSLYDGAVFALNRQLSAHSCIQTDGTGLYQSSVSVSPSTCASAFKLVASASPSSSSAVSVGGGVVWYAPIGSALGLLMAGMSTPSLVYCALVGFWSHCTLVLLFANILPYTKHFHIITSIPNVFLSKLAPYGRLGLVANSSDALMELVGGAAELDDPNEVKVGVARAEHFSWKNVLDVYSCTECGRCSDNCPAHTTGKILSPKKLTLDIRDHFYKNSAQLTNRSVRGRPPTESSTILPIPVDLIPGVVHPDVIWGCTTCRACEEYCPVMIDHVDRIVELRRNQVMIAGEFPHALAKPFESMESNGNPWGLSRIDRAAWTEGLEVTTMADKPDADVLYWVGCAASYDDRAKKVARAFARLLKAANVDFAILGEEESCTGDSARRAGNEYLYATLAEKNIEVLNSYKNRGGVGTIVTACPHCFNTLANEYPDLGGHYKVVHHADFLLELVRSGKLTPRRRVNARAVFHDSCYLGRYNNLCDASREVLRAVPGIELIEPAHHTRNQAFCCGAGGAQMWMEEQNKNRISTHRTRQLLESRPTTMATACPFCLTMLIDGYNDVVDNAEVHCGADNGVGRGSDSGGTNNGLGQVEQLDIAEVLARSCLNEPTNPGAAAGPDAL